MLMLLNNYLETKEGDIMKYMTPELEMIKFAVEDVMGASINGVDPDTNYVVDPINMFEGG